MNPVICIVSITKNDSAELSRTRASIVKQDYENWFHIIIDGASDSQHQAYLKFLSQEHRTSVVSEEDEGIYYAMNKGWKLSKEDSYILYLNAGDELTSIDSLSSFVKHIRECDFPELVFTQFEQCNYDGSEAICKPIAPSPENQLFAYGYVSHQSTVTKRSVLDRLGGFDTRFKVAADWDFIVRAMKSHSFIVLNICLVRFYLGGFSTRNIGIAHQELRFLRHKYLRRNVQFYFLEYIWELIYLRFLKRMSFLRVILSPFVALAQLTKFCLFPIQKADSYLKNLILIKRSGKHEWGKNLAKSYFFLRFLLVFPVISIRRFLYTSEIAFRNWLYCKLGLKPIFKSSIE